MQIRKEQIKDVYPLQIYNQNYTNSVSVGGTSDSVIIDTLPSYPASFADIGNSSEGTVNVLSGLLFDATYKGGDIGDTFTCFKASLMLVSSNILLNKPV